MDVIVDNLEIALVFLKWVLIISFALYVAFAVVVVRQVRVMTQTLEVGFEKQVLLLSYLHLIISIGIFIYALFVL